MVYVYQNLHNADDDVHVLQSTQSSVELDKKGVMKVTNDEELIESLYKQVHTLETKLENKKVIVITMDTFGSNETDQLLQKLNVCMYDSVNDGSICCAQWNLSIMNLWGPQKLSIRRFFLLQRFNSIQ